MVSYSLRGHFGSVNLRVRGDLHPAKNVDQAVHAKEEAEPERAAVDVGPHLLHWGVSYHVSCAPVAAGGREAARTVRAVRGVRGDLDRIIRQRNVPNGKCDAQELDLCERWPQSQEAKSMSNLKVVRCMIYAAVR